MLAPHCLVSQAVVYSAKSVTLLVILVLKRSRQLNHGVMEQMPAHLSKFELLNVHFWIYQLWFVLCQPTFRLKWSKRMLGHFQPALKYQHSIKIKHRKFVLNQMLANETGPTQGCVKQTATMPHLFWIHDIYRNLNSRDTATELLPR